MAATVPGIVVERPLGGLTVMNVPVDDENSSNGRLVQYVPSGYRYVIEKAVTAVFGFHGVVSGRPENKQKTQRKSRAPRRYDHSERDVCARPYEIYLTRAIPLCARPPTTASTNSTEPPAASRDCL